MAIAFTAVIDAAPNVDLISESVVTSGLALGSNAVNIIGTPGQLSVNGGGWTTSSSVSNGDAIRLKTHTPNSQAGDVTTVTLSVASLGSYVLWVVTNINNTLDEAVTVTDAALAFGITMGELPVSVATVSDWASGDGFALVDESGVVVDEPLPLFRAQALVLESVTVDGVGMPVIDWQVDEAATVADSATVAAYWLERDGATVSDSSSSVLTAQGLVNDAATATDAPLPVTAWYVYETATILDEALLFTGVYQLATDTATAASDIASLATTMTAIVDEGALASDWVDAASTLALYLNSTVYASDEAIFEAFDYMAWVFNTRTQALSRWTGLPIHQVHQANGVLYGLSPQGLYVLDASVGVDASVSTGLYDFSKNEVKMLDVGYVTYMAEQPIELDAVASSGGLKTATTYRQAAYTADVPRQSRIKFGRGRSARYWGFVLRNTDQGSTTIQDLRIVPLVGSRRI